MTTNIDDLGLVIDRYAALVSEYEAAAKGVWGESLDTSQTELIGHFIRQCSLDLAEINETLQAVYDVLSSANVSGNRLDHLFALIDLPRQSAARSTVPLTYTVSDATTIPAGHRVRTAAGVVFQTLANLTFVGAGSDTVTAQCTEYGPYDAGIGEVNTPVNTLYGFVSVTNAAAAIPGRLRETDPQFRRRHTDAVATSGEDDVASIYEAVAAVTGVSSTYVEDDEDLHIISVSVIGGSDNDVATAINNSRTAGIQTVGTTSVDVYSTVTGQTKTTRFTRAADRSFVVAMTLTKNSALFPADGDDQIRNNLIAVAATYRIKDPVDYFALLAPIYRVPGVIVNALSIGWTVGTLGTSNLTTTAAERATLAAGDISIGYTS